MFLLELIAAAIVFAMLSAVAAAFFPLGLAGRVAGLW